MSRLGLGLSIMVPASARPTPTTAPVNTALPSITGIQTQGQVLTANPGSWTGLPSGVFAYQWKRGATNIGTNSANYTLVSGDVGQNIAVVVTATNNIGSTPATSAAIIPAAVLSLTGTPGAPTVGTPYSFTPTRTGGHASGAPIPFALTGTLLAGLSFNGATGAITGTPTSAGTASGLDITYTDADGLTASLGTFSLTATSGTFTAGDGFTAPSLTYRGASNIQGNQDGSGVTLITRVQDRVINDAALLNAGISGAANTATLTKYQTTNASNVSGGDPLSYKTNAQYLQLGGSNDASTDPRSRMTNVASFVAGFTTNAVPSWTLLVAFNASATGAGTDGWVRKRVFYQLAMAAWPGKVGYLGKYLSSATYFPPADGTDSAAQALDYIPPSYEYAPAPGHCDAGGYVSQADAVAFPHARAVAGILPWLAWPEVYSTASTANTASGLVADVDVFGDLAGITVDLMDNTTNFAVAVQATGFGTSKLRITRNAGGAIAAAYTRLSVRFRNPSSAVGPVEDTYFIDVGIGPLDNGVYEVDCTGRGGHIAAWENFSGVTNSKKLSFFMKFRPLSGSNGTSYFICTGDAGATQQAGINVQRTAGNGIQIFIRNGVAASPSTYTKSSFAATVDDTKDCCIFFSADIDAGIAFGRVESRSFSGGAVTSTDQTGINTAGANLGMATIHRFFETPGRVPMPVRHGVIWMAADYIDFSDETNRALFRNVSTLAAANPYDGANSDRVTIVAGTGAGNNVTPYCSIRGNAAKLVLGNPNRGTGTSQTDRPADTGRLVFDYPGSTATTV